MIMRYVNIICYNKIVSKSEQSEKMYNYMCEMMNKTTKRNSWIWIENKHWTSSTEQLQPRECDQIE